MAVSANTSLPESLSEADRKLVDQARAAISAGRDRAAVSRMLKEMGVSPEHLGQTPRAMTVTTALALGLCLFSIPFLQAPIGTFFREEPGRNVAAPPQRAIPSPARTDVEPVRPVLPSPVAPAPAPQPAALPEEDPSSILADAKAAYDSQDFATATSKLQSLAAKGNPFAQAKLGHLLLKGQVSPGGESEGLALLQKAADQGNAESMGRIGDAYRDGRGVVKNDALAATWWAKGAERGDPYSMDNLAQAYKNGAGVNNDAAMAIRYFEMAARHDMADALSFLSAIYRRGELVEADVQKALTYCDRAARHGQENCQYRLAIAYNRGEGKPRDVEAAFKWAYISAMHGQPEPIRYRDRIAKELRPARLSALQAEAEREGAEYDAVNRDIVERRAKASWGLP